MTSLHLAWPLLSSFHVGLYGNCSVVHFLCDNFSQEACIQRIILCSSLYTVFYWNYVSLLMALFPSVSAKLLNSRVQLLHIPHSVSICTTEYKLTEFKALFRRAEAPCYTHLEWRWGIYVYAAARETKHMHIVYLQLEMETETRGRKCSFRHDELRTESGMLIGCSLKDDTMCMHILPLKWSYICSPYSTGLLAICEDFSIKPTINHWHSLLLNDMMWPSEMRRFTQNSGQLSQFFGFNVCRMNPPLILTDVSIYNAHSASACVTWCSNKGHNVMLARDHFCLDISSYNSWISRLVKSATLIDLKFDAGYRTEGIPHRMLYCLQNYKCIYQLNNDFVITMASLHACFAYK